MRKSNVTARCRAPRHRRDASSISRLTRCFYAGSDPRCTFELTGVDDPWKSHTVKKCLDPKFHEQFVRLLDVPGDGSSPSLTVTCEDVDEVSGADFMGAAPRLPSSLRVDGVPSSNPPHAIAATQANSPWTSGP